MPLSILSIWQWTRQVSSYQKYVVLSVIGESRAHFHTRGEITTSFQAGLQFN